jgi:nucleotide-binding universal stress UspA family protein
LAQAGQKLLVDAMMLADGIDAEALLLQANNRRVSETVVEKSKELNVDLIIIGRHGRRGLATFILGSAAEQIARIADASVLLVRKH